MDPDKSVPHVNEAPRTPEVQRLGKGAQVTVRYYGLYANAHRGKVKKVNLASFPLLIMKDELRPIPSKGWAEMIRKVYEVDPMVCPQCGGQMKVIAFLTDYAVVDRIINHLKLTFVVERPPPPQFAYQEVLMAANPAATIFLNLSLPEKEKSGRFPALFGLSAGSRPALHYVELNLTSRSIAFYDFLRREEPKLVVERPFGKRSRKRNTYT